MNPPPDKTMDYTCRNNQQIMYLNTNPYISNANLIPNQNQKCKMKYIPTPKKNHKIGIIGLSVLSFISIILFAGLICLMIFTLKDSVVGLVLVGLASFALLAIFIYSITFLILLIIKYRDYKRNNIVECQLDNNSSEDTLKNSIAYSQQAYNQLNDVNIYDDPSIIKTMNTSIQTYSVPVQMTQIVIPSNDCIFPPLQYHSKRPNSFNTSNRNDPPSPAMYPPPGFFPSQNYPSPFFSKPPPPPQHMVNHQCDSSSSSFKSNLQQTSSSSPPSTSPEANQTSKTNNKDKTNQENNNTKNSSNENENK
ncbi:hypothetical protein BCR36DRAFT_158441 [Piromyces finnis]|uniref:Uncharacterized protein n=1 Tax=Piromyces finnis TaxID=1754191 RepID=A0A1Y1UXP2_9FUNG|nr:hypothetical protein BCR36DRAFT_158441 [Piromyces finnis]|eukprot:ORX42489.1 hypothetical protein BCR36DRAFT_158441 [Piromyces finnis]